MSESRFERARRIARETAPERQRQEREREQRLDDRLRHLGPEEAHRRAIQAGRDASLPYVGPVKTPGTWREAVEIARMVTIAAARRRSTITYGEIRHAIIEELGHRVGHNQFAELVMSMNREARHRVLISSIVVQKGTGKPGSGFLPYARSQGIDLPLETMQRRVFDHFS